MSKRFIDTTNKFYRNVVKFIGPEAAMVDPFVKTGGRAVVRATLLLCLPCFRMNQAVYLLHTLQQESGNQEPDGAADDYKTRNSCLIAGEHLSVRYSHANRLLHI